jgi:putative ABC transport system permease protein
LAESLLLCSAGAILGVLSARPMVTVLARYASRFSVRALDLTIDSSMLWVGPLMAVLAAIFLAFVPRLSAAGTSHGFGLGGSGLRVAGNANRRLRVLAVIQIAAPFLLLAGASVLLKTLLALQSTPTPFDTDHVFAINVPSSSYGRTPDQTVSSYQEAIRRISALPGVEAVTVGSTVPWRDAKSLVSDWDSRPTATYGRRGKTIQK